MGLNKEKRQEQTADRANLVRITPLRFLIILYGHEVSSYRDFTAAIRSIVRSRRGYRHGKIVASGSHRYDTVNSSRKYSRNIYAASVAFRS